MNGFMAPQAVARKYGVPVDEPARRHRHHLGPACYVLTRRTVRYDSGSVDTWFQDPTNARFHGFASSAFNPETTRDDEQDPE